MYLFCATIVIYSCYWVLQKPGKTLQYDIQMEELISEQDEELQVILNNMITDDKLKERLSSDFMRDMITTICE